MNQTINNIHILIPAGGSGSRFGGDKKKQFLQLKNESILNRTIRCFLDLPEVTTVVVSLPVAELNQVESLFDDRLMYVAGGKTRSESVYNAFDFIPDLKQGDVVLIHDAARPLVSVALIQRVIQALQSHDAVIPALPVSDTIKQVSSDGVVAATIDRNGLFAVQTPQGFRAETLQKAYQQLDFRDARFTDESMLVEALGVKVHIVAGESSNIKITHPQDIRIAEALI